MVERQAPENLGSESIGHGWSTETDPGIDLFSAGVQVLFNHGVPAVSEEGRADLFSQHLIIAKPLIRGSKQDTKIYNHSRV